MGVTATWLGAAGLANSLLGLAKQPEQPTGDLDQRRREEALANKRKLQRERDRKREAEELEDARKQRSRNNDTLGGAGAGASGEAAVHKNTLKSRLGQ